ncbi:acyltransferase [Empedobacter tilapiae]|uniref:acyltransferase family protein n=1 Tax=Empedobacter tilapiae TaxID=2491114 RepID=UPI0028D6DC3F|nr:acyltransferase [Empedobacter tilapiae]
MKNEIKSLTGLRGIAAVYVMIFHYFKNYSENLNNKFGGIFDYTDNIIKNGYISVDLFFILSAFVLTLSYNSKFEYLNFSTYKDYFIKRLIRIYPLYLVVFLISLFYQNNISSSFIITHLTLTESLFDTLIGSVNYSVWSLSTEFILYLFFPFILFFIYKIKSKIVDLLLVIISLIFLYKLQCFDTYFISLSKKTIERLPSKNSLEIVIGSSAIIRTFITYMLGVMFFKNIKKIPNIISVCISIILFLSITLDFNDIIIYILFFFLIKSLLQNNILSRLMSNKIIYYLGEISYSIYLNHIIVLVALTKFNPFKLNENGVIFLLTSITVTLLISIFTYEVIEKKSKKYFLKIYNKKASD